MKHKLKEAGINTNKAVLKVAAENALRRSKQNFDRALSRFLIVLRGDPELLEALAVPFLRQCQRDMEGSGSLNSIERLNDHDHAPDLSSSRPSPTIGESHRRPDRPAAPLTRDDVASPNAFDIQCKHDRSVVPAPKKIATVSTDMKRVARKTDVYDTVIGNSISFRNAVLYDLINGKRAGDTVSYVCGTIIDEFHFPDMYDTKVPDIVPAPRLKAILAEARARLEVPHVR